MGEVTRSNKECVEELHHLYPPVNVFKMTQ